MSDRTLKKNSPVIFHVVTSDGKTRKTIRLTQKRPNVILYLENKYVFEPIREPDFVRRKTEALFEAAFDGLRDLSELDPRAANEIASYYGI